MYVMLTLVGIVPFLIAAQVIRLGVFEGSELREKGENQSTASVPIPALRGTILDRKGRALVVDVERYDLALDPTADGFKENAAKYYEKLARLTGHPVSVVRRKIQQRTSPAYVLLERNVQMAADAKQELEGIPGMRIDANYSRRYNHGSIAAHILGHVDADQRGLAGLEEEYDDYLRGVPGERAAQRDRRGHMKLVPGGPVVPPRHGENLVLTIDLVQQTILEEELARGVKEAGAKWGTAAAMNPYTGEILALANYPTYDPNRPGAFTNTQRRNHFVTDQIEPGSTYKLVAAVASIETGIVSMSDSIDTSPGWVVSHGHTIRDTHPHGKIPFEDVIAVSSNVGFHLVSEKLDRGAFYQYSRQLGFGEISGVDLPGEVGGLLYRTSLWSGSTRSAMSRGYEINVTPLQLLSAYAALANGGVLIRPHIVAERRDVLGNTTWTARSDSIRRAFDRETASTILPAFEKVVDAGTAEQALVSGLRIAGKTGTAKKTRNGVYVDGLYRATFVGFYPVEHPEVVLIVIMDEPRSSIYGGSVSAPVFQRATERWLGTIPSHADRFAVADTTFAESLPSVPDVTGLPASVARRRLQRVGLAAWSARELPDQLTVAGQSPEPGVPEEEVRQVTLKMPAEATPEAKVMPDVTGMGAREAFFWLDSEGVQVKLEGHGRVVRQSPAAGKPIPDQVVLYCR